MTTSLKSGTRAFVTGADGFIGSHLVEALVQLGCSVRALVYYNSWNTLGWLSDLPAETLSSIEVLQGDVRDAERMASAIADSDFVFHLASLIGIPYSYVAPRSYVETNVAGTLNILEACRRSDRLVRLVHTSTSEVYGTAQTVPIAETHPLVGQSPYSATKIGADKLAESYFLSFGLPVVTARPFNTFGPRQTARAVIPTIASQLLARVPELKLGSLTPTRDFNFVTDTVGGFIALANCTKANGRVVNIGTGQEWSIEETVQSLMKITNHFPSITCEEGRVRPQGSEVNRLIASVEVIRSITQWSPATSFQEGLEMTTDWISRNLHHFDHRKYSI